MALFLVGSVPERTVVLDGDEARHAATVRRVRAGEYVGVSDGAGTMARCVVEAVHAGREPELELSVEHRWCVELPEPRVTVVQALVKGERGELAVELATEAGADTVIPWRAARSVARWDDGVRGAKGLRRWRRTAESAAKQSDRAWLPNVADPVDTNRLAELVRAADRALILDAGADSAFAELNLPARGELLVVVGPEGGLNEAELAALDAAGAVRTRLGPTVLRASTAAAVVLGAIGARTGRWS